MDQYPWRRAINPSEIDIIASDGTIRGRVTGYYAHTGDLIFVEDVNADIRPGDEVRRLLPNGKEETFIVDDPQYMNVGHLGMPNILNCLFLESTFMNAVREVITIYM